MATDCLMGVAQSCRMRRGGACPAVAATGCSTTLFNSPAAVSFAKNAHQRRESMEKGHGLFFW